MRIPATDRLLAFLGYFPLLFLLPVRLRRQSLFAQFHGRQSGVLFGLWALFCLVLFLALLFVPDQGAVAVWFFGAMAVATFLYAALALVGMVKVLLGERYRMPVVADVALRLHL